MRLVLIGAPGSGKGTQARRLCERLGLVYIGTGDILREAIRLESAVGREARPLIDAGRLVPDTMANDMVADLFRARRPEKFVLDGYPRTYSQAIALDALLAQQFLKLDAVVDLAVDDDEVVRRIGGRRCCSNAACGVCYNLAFQPTARPGICDRCGHPLAERPDDGEATIRTRLEEFHANTDALVEHYRRAGLLKEISAVDPVETIYANILRRLPERG